MTLPPGVGAYGLVTDYRYGRAFEQLERLPNFAGNATGSYRIGGTYVERVASVAFQVAAVGAATRTPIVDLLDEEGNVFSGAAASATITAGVTSIFVFAFDAFAAGAANAPRIVTPLPMPFLQPTYSLRISVAAGLVADTVSGVRILAQKFSTAPQDFPPGQGETVTAETIERDYAFPRSVV